MEGRKEGNYEDKIRTRYRVKDEKGRGRSRKEEGKVPRNIGRGWNLLARLIARFSRPLFLLTFESKNERAMRLMGGKRDGRGEEEEEGEEEEKE